MSETPETHQPAANSASAAADADERPASFALDTRPRTIPSAVSNWSGRVRTGNPGALPSMLGIIVLAVIFFSVSHRFLGLNNLGNLPSQFAYTALMAIGLVFVLLLGEIDLSAGTAGGLCAGFAGQAILSGGLKAGVPGALWWSMLVLMLVALGTAVLIKLWSGAIVVAIGLILMLTGLTSHVIPALLFAVTAGTAIGILTGWLVAKVGIPSFVVTLALFLAWQGVLLFAINSQSVPLVNFTFWYGLAHNNMSPLWSWVFTIVVCGGYLAYTLFRSVRLRGRGLTADSLSLVLVKGALVTVIGVVVTVAANINRAPAGQIAQSGLPWAITVPIVLMIAATIVLTKTQWGRHLFAAGGNMEAARRAGIDTERIKISAFTVCSSFAAIGGLFLASQNNAANNGIGGGNTLLFAVAAAVIGGTSLFGGRGKPRDAILGGLVIAMIPNGLGLKPSLPAQWQTVITGAVLLIAAGVDALSRRSSSRQ
ncbi:MAG: ABC transporter permease [Actinomycetota bacterium]|nr:ABC transporter permease [Actinomycetota bacterium]